MREAVLFECNRMHNIQYIKDGSALAAPLQTGFNSYSQVQYCIIIIVLLQEAFLRPIESHSTDLHV